MHNEYLYPSKFKSLQNETRKHKKKYNLIFYVPVNFVLRLWINMQKSIETNFKQLSFEQHSIITSTDSPKSRLL